MQRSLLAARRLLRAPLLLALFVAALLAGCAFHPGGAQIAYLNGDQLWVVNPDSSQPRELATQDVRGFSWSPDHHELVFRYGAATAENLPGATWAPSEGVSELATTSISGGQPLQITPTAPHLARSDAWWDPQGNRLLYREYVPGTALISAIYIESQNDQPVGIARKIVVDAATLPTLSPDGSRVAVIDPQGGVHAGTASQPGDALAQNALTRIPSDGLPARILWRPGHDALVYFTAGDNGATTLNLLDLTSHKSQPITSMSGLRDAAFSPDGSMLLLANPTGYLIWPMGGQAPRAAIPESDPLAQVYWSPDSRWLLVEDRSGARLIRASDWSVQGTLAYASALPQPQVNDTTLWRPAASSPWSADSSAFTFASGSATWQGKPLPTPASGAVAGLYVEQVGQSTTQGSPTLIASGNISAPSWSAPDPSTTLLMAAG